MHIHRSPFFFFLRKPSLPRFLPPRSSGISTHHGIADYISQRARRLSSQARAAWGRPSDLPPGPRVERGWIFASAPIGRRVSLRGKPRSGWASLEPKEGPGGGSRFPGGAGGTGRKPGLGAAASAWRQPQMSRWAGWLRTCVRSPSRPREVSARLFGGGGECNFKHAQMSWMQL